jgi:hypothetical protein
MFLSERDFAYLKVLEQAEEEGHCDASEYLFGECGSRKSKNIKNSLRDHSSFAFLLR